MHPIYLLPSVLFSQSSPFISQVLLELLHLLITSRETVINNIATQWFIQAQPRTLVNMKILKIAPQDSQLGCIPKLIDLLCKTAAPHCKEYSDKGSQLQQVCFLHQPEVIGLCGGQVWGVGTLKK